MPHFCFNVHYVIRSSCLFLYFFFSIFTPHVLDALQTQKLRIGIYGFGTFGQFLAKRFRERHLPVFATSKTDYSSVSQILWLVRLAFYWYNLRCSTMQSQCVKDFGVVFIPGENIDELLNHNINVLILSMSIRSFEEAVEKIPMYEPGHICK